MKVNLDELRKRSEYISCREHPELDLLIWNYNNSCQFDRAWDDYTSMARGLITDLDGNVISRPFPKFFNVGETEKTQMHRLPASIPEIREKLDGWLGVGYTDGQRPYISSRGSFDSEGAIWATGWIQERYEANDFLDGYTYVYEIICPLTRIILDYRGRAELVLLAVINTEDRSELDIDAEGLRLGVETAALLAQDIWTLEKDMESLPITQEGYVLRYPDGFRVKMKGHEYRRMARALMHCSTTAVWDWIQAGGSVDGFNEYLPGELWEWVNAQATVIQATYDGLMKDVEAAYVSVKDIESRKDQAACLIADYKKIAWMVFVKLDGRELTGTSLRKSWEMIKPEFELPTFA